METDTSCELQYFHISVTLSLSPSAHLFITKIHSNNLFPIKNCLLSILAFTYALKYYVTVDIHAISIIAYFLMKRSSSLLRTAPLIAS